jgi:integrase
MSRLYKRSGKWYADYVDRDGQRVRRCTKMKDKQLAGKVLSLWESEERQVEVGLKPRTKNAEPLVDYLRQFDSNKAAAGKSLQHILRTSQLIHSLADFAGWKNLGDIEADGITRYAEHLKQDGEQANRTIASMITAVRTFCRWCVRNGHLAADPTATVDKPSIKIDRRIERRMVLPEEWSWLKLALKTDSIKNGQDSTERLLMYRLAIESGLRSSELRSLTRGALSLSGDNPHVTVKAAITKNSKTAKQYISDELAADLTKLVARKLPGALVFNVASRTEMARTLRIDVVDARRLWLETPEGKRDKDSDFLKSPTSQGEVLDFHALRHTCGAWLVQQGVSLNETKEIMRHSTITLTADCYGHLAPDARSRSRSVLGAMLG